MNKNIAKLVKDRLSGFVGRAALFSVSPPVVFGEGEKADFVVVSTCKVPFSGWETYVFPACKSGSVRSWSELDGSSKGWVSRKQALAGLGYKLV